MAQIWYPQDKKVYLSWIEAITTESSEELNDWEEKFIESIGTRLLTGKDLTEPMASKLEEIYVKHTN